MIHALGPGGAERNYVRLCQGLLKRNIPLDCFVLKKKHTHLEEIADESGFNLQSLDVSLKSGLLTLICFFYQRRHQDKLFFNIFLASISITVTKLTGGKGKNIVRLINTSSKVIENEKNKLLKFSTKFVLKFIVPLANSVIAQSEGMKNDYLNLISPRRIEIAVIYNPAPPLTQCNYSNKRDLLFVGRLTRNKGLDNLIEVMRRVVISVPDATLRIVGDGPLRENVEQQIKQYSLHESIIMEGLQKDVTPYYQRSRTTLLTSLYEGFPNVLLESLAAGTPIISFDCPSGPSEIIEEGKNGFLIANSDCELMAKKIVQLLKNPNSMSDFKEIQSTSLKFSYEKMIQSYVTILESDSNV